MSSRDRPRALPRAPGRLGTTLLAAGLAVTGTWVGAYAAWTDTVVATSTFSSGSIRLTANGATTTYAFTSLDVAGLAPGATPTYALLTVANAGSVALSWSLATTATANQLSTDLRVGVVRIAGATCDAAAFTGGTTLWAEAAGLASVAVASRPLAAGASDRLCFKVSLPSTSTNASANLTSTATMTLSATS